MVRAGHGRPHAAQAAARAPSRARGTGPRGGGGPATPSRGPALHAAARPSALALPTPCWAGRHGTGVRRPPAKPPTCQPPAAPPAPVRRPAAPAAAPPWREARGRRADRCLVLLAACCVVWWVAVGRAGGGARPRGQGAAARAWGVGGGAPHSRGDGGPHVGRRVRPRAARGAARRRGCRGGGPAAAAAAYLRRGRGRASGWGGGVAGAPPGSSKRRG
jgi:hypothetical protein